MRSRWLITLVLLSVALHAAPSASAQAVCPNIAYTGTFAKGEVITYVDEDAALHLRTEPAFEGNVLGDLVAGAELRITGPSVPRSRRWVLGGR